MIRGASDKHHKKRGKDIHGCRPRFVGLMSAARKLEVHRSHLYQVLRGDRTSHSLLAKVKLTPVRKKPGYVKVEVL
jgi:hypothetical protein